MRCDEKRDFDSILSTRVSILSPRMYLFIFPEGTQHSLASCSSCPAGLHLGILMMNRDRSCATRSSAKATGTFIMRTTQHSQRDHLGPEQAIFLPGSRLTVLLDVPLAARSQGRRREIEKPRFTSSTSFRLGILDLTGLASLGWASCLPDLPDPLKPSRSQRPKIGKRTAYEVQPDRRSAVSRRSTRPSAEWNARYESGPSLKRLRLVLSVVSLGM
jgi:hypothetical protein